MREVFEFLKDLEENNTREWFNAHKDEFRSIEATFTSLVNKVELGVSTIDNIEVGSTKIFRIYRDVRFSADKTPYHLHRSVSFKRASQERRGGYYLKIKRGESVIAGGFFGPNPSDMLHIRKQIQQDPEPLIEILSSPEIHDFFGGLSGEQVKSAPRGFSKDDPAIDLLKYKQLLLVKNFSDEEAQSSTFHEKVVDGFAKMRPFLDFMSEILTTDLNGELLNG